MTATELWRLRPERPDELSITPLAHRLGRAITLGVAGNRLAVPLEGGAIDVFRDGAREHTLRDVMPPESWIESLRFSADASVLAVTYQHENKATTQLFDVASARMLGRVPGSRPELDAAHRRVSTSHGLFGFDGARVLDMPEAPSDYNLPTRGFFGDAAVFAGVREITRVHATGRVERVPSVCAGRKIVDVFDGVHARVLSVCTGEVLVTTLADSAQVRIKASFDVQRDDVQVVPAAGVSFFVRPIGKPTLWIDPATRTVQEQSIADVALEQLSSPRVLCVHDSLYRSAGCMSPALRGDGAFRMKIERGLTLAARGAEKPLLDWSSRGVTTREPSWLGGALELDSHAATPKLLRLGPPRSHAPTPALREPCDTRMHWLPFQLGDTRASYFSFTERGQRLCACSSERCAVIQLGGRDRELAAFQSESAYVDLERVAAGTQYTARRAGRPPLTALLPHACGHGAFVGDPGSESTEQLILICHESAGTALVSLSARDLTRRAQRMAPIEWGPSPTIVPAGMDWLYVTLDHAVRLAPDWIERGGAPLEEIEIGTSWAARRRAAGGYDLFGDEHAARAQILCHDGARLHPFGSCH